MAVKGKVPDFAVVLYVERVLIHCPKCVSRGGLWDPQRWPDSSKTPGIGEAMIVHAKLDVTPDELHEEAAKDGTADLY